MTHLIFSFIMEYNFYTLVIYYVIMLYIIPTNSEVKTSKKSIDANT